MISRQLLEVLVCPENRTALAMADEALLARANRALAAGQLKNRAGEALEKPLEAGLVRQDRTVLYPIVDGIPILLVDEGIFLDQLQRGA